MPVTPEEAVSAAVRGVERALHAGPPRSTHKEYADFLYHVEEAHTRALGDTGVDAQDGYLRARVLAVTALLALAHYPHLAEIDEAAPGERLDG